VTERERERERKKERERSLHGHFRSETLEWVITREKVVFASPAPVIRGSCATRIVAVAISAATIAPPELFASSPSRVSVLVKFVGIPIESRESKGADEGFHAYRPDCIKEIGWAG